MYARIAAIGLVITLSSSAHSAPVLWTTGAARTIDYQFIVFRTYTGFGYLSGYSDATAPQRWAAVPFRLNQPSRITELDAYYSNPNGYATNVAFRIWNRTNLEAPTTVAATGNLGPYVSVADEGTAANNPAAHLHQHNIDVMLPAGDYYLSLYATGPAWIAWWTGGGLQDSALEANSIWRSAAFPSPGFQPWSFTGSSNLLADPRDVYNLAFTLRGTPSARPGDFDLNGAVDGGDFLAWQRNSSVGNLADWRANYGTSSLATAKTAVPEPASAALTAIGLTCVAICRARSKRSSARLLAAAPLTPGRSPSPTSRACHRPRRGSLISTPTPIMRVTFLLVLLMIRLESTVRGDALPFTIPAPEQSLSPLLDGLISPGEYKSSLAMTYADSANPGRFIPALMYEYDGTDSDLSATLFAAHTTTSLFLAFRVFDDVLDAESGQLPFRNDSVELVFDGDRASNDFGPFASIGGNQEGFQLIADSQGQKFAQGVGTDGWSVATSTLLDGYIIEFMIPLNLIDTTDGPGITPAATGDILRFNGSITDNDRPVDAQDNFGAFWLEDEWFTGFGTDLPSPFIAGEAVWVIDLELAAIPEPSTNSLCVLSIVALSASDARRAAGICRKLA
jgi:hypothetical protein